MGAGELCSESSPLVVNSSRTHPFHTVWGQVLDRGLQHLHIPAFCFLGKRKQPSCSLILSKAGASVCKTDLQNRSKKGLFRPNVLFVAFRKASSFGCPPSTKASPPPSLGFAPQSSSFCSPKRGQGLILSPLKPSRAWLTGQEGLLINLFSLLHHPRHQSSPHPPHS